MEIIINNEDAFTEIVKFLKKYFENVKVIKNKNSHLANRSQNFWKTIIFENRDVTYSILWNYGYCCLYYGKITSPYAKTSFQYTFTKIKLDKCYPVEEMNNCNVVFWMYEQIDPFNDMPNEISPLRFPVTLRS